MKTLNLSITTFIFFLILVQTKVIACDDFLKVTSVDPLVTSKLKKECDIQDRFRKVQKTYHDFNLNINHVAEYRAIRLIDRFSWERNVSSGNAAPKWIYNPMPTTWDIWDNGIKLIFESNRRPFESIIDVNNITYINTVLLTEGASSVKDIGSDQGLKPGELRESMFDSSIGFCMNVDLKILDKIITDSANANKAYFQAWEKKSGITIKELVKKYNGISPSKADIAISVNVPNRKCNDGIGYFAEYIESGKVKRSLEWLKIFLDYNLSQYKNGAVIVSPIELSAIIQKQFVSIHPFADGNGRTSRAIQDLVLEKFDMPYAPGGDLQNDALENPETYIQNTYSKMESMLTFLESCAVNLENGTTHNPRCQIIND
jgi:hypothetical protein